jgi:hypothetical protein
MIVDKNAKTDQLLSKKLSEYIRDYLVILHETMPKSLEAQKKNWIHLAHAVDCLDIDSNFRF